MNKITEIPNRIKQPSICCIYCGKNYKTRTRMEKHVLLCEIIHKSSKSKRSSLDDDYEEDLQIPSQKILYQMVLELGEKYNRLNKKMEEYEKWIVRKKKKINVIEWLNGNLKPEIGFDKMYERIKIIDSDIEILFYNNFNDTLSEIFERNLCNNEMQQNPIFAFVQKPNIFYIYEKITRDGKSDGKSDDNTDDETEEYKWIELSKEKLIKFMNIILKNMIRCLSEWKKKNNETVKMSDTIATTYDKALIKLMSVELKQDAILNKIRTTLYSKLKTDMKALVEYEFEF